MTRTVRRAPAVSAPRKRPLAMLPVVAPPAVVATCRIADDCAPAIAAVPLHAPLRPLISPPAPDPRASGVDRTADGLTPDGLARDVAARAGARGRAASDPAVVEARGDRIRELPAENDDVRRAPGA